MIKVENVEAWGFKHAIRGMRNPMNSWDKSDSKWVEDWTAGQTKPGYKEYVIGENDFELMQRLYKAGTEHRKYLRQIFVSMDITAPLYWWKEFDTYKIGTTANSCSTMHKIAAKEFELDDFSHEHLEPHAENALRNIIGDLNAYRSLFLQEKDKQWWRQMIQLLPSSYNQKRTVTMNYENVVNIVNQRTGHKLDEWNEFVAVLKNLPYLEDIIYECEV